MSVVQIHGVLALGFSTPARTWTRRPKPGLRPMGWRSSDATCPSLRSCTAPGRSEFQPDWLRRTVRFRRVPSRPCLD